VREVETKLQPTAMPANPPGWTPEKTPKFESLLSIDEVSSCNQCFLWGEIFVLWLQKKLGKKIWKKSPKLRKPRI
jgi:hypothetical protein